jgi:DNA polymerase-3 subunit delta
MGAYIFLGPELGKKQDALDSARKKFSGAEESVFYANETPVNTITDTLQNMSLFAEKRIVTVKNAECIKKKDEVELLASCIENLDTHTAFFLLSDENKIASGLEEAVPKSNRQIFYELFEKEKTEWVRQFFKQEGFNIDKDGIAVILELVENNTAALKRECSRLVGFLPKDRPIDPQDIDKLLSHNREESAFTLFSRIAAGDISKALESMSVMLAAKESAQSILAGLAWCFRKLGDYLALLETSAAPDSFELKKIGLSSPKAKDDYAAAAHRYNTEDVEACLALTSEYDILLRSPVAALENLLMDRYILALFTTASQNRR